MYAVEQRVTHPRSGDGVVMDVDEQQPTVLFSDVGYRTLSLPAVIREGLLAPI